MEILNCYIENFGKLQAQSFEFSQGFNSVLQKNGYGKTTLANFIKAMFYGMPATTKRDIDQNEGKKYLPWQGGAYGGNLCFKVNGKSYKVERFFGKKESEDSFNLYDLQTGKKTNVFSEALGFELFGLDADAYEKCTFVPQKEIESGVNESISSKLLNVVNGAGNAQSLEKALAVLEEKRGEIRKKGGAGKLSDVQEQIDQVERKIANLKDLAPSIDVISAQIEENNEKINEQKAKKEEINKKISAVAENEKLIANQKYIQEKQETRRQLAEKSEHYQKIVGENKLVVDDVSLFENKYKQYQNTITKIETIKSGIKHNEDFIQLEKQWGENHPSKDDITKAIELSQQKNKIESEIDVIKNLPSTSVKTKEIRKNKAMIFALCCFAGVFALSIAMLFINKMASIIGFACGGVLLVYAGFQYLKNYIDKQTKINADQRVPFDKSELNEKQNLLSQINSYLEDFKEKYKVDQDLTPANLSSLLLEVKEYEISREHQEDSRKRILESQKASEMLLFEINRFLEQFDFPSDVQSIDEKLSLLREICTNFSKIAADIKSVDNKLSEFTEKEQKNREIVQIDGLNIEKLQIEERNIQHKIDELRDIHSDLSNKLQSVQEEIVSLDELENDLQDLKMQKKNLQYQLNVIEKTKEILKLSNDNLLAKFLLPIKTNLNKYAGKFASESELVLNPDINLNITFDKNGASRDLAFLSKGYQTVVDLCIRLSLIDKLFEKEKPFIILDDPFVNMDEEKLASAMKLLKSVAKEYQIIYLVCHCSRA